MGQLLARHRTTSAVLRIKRILAASAIAVAVNGVALVFGLSVTTAVVLGAFAGGLAIPTLRRLWPAYQVPDTR